MGIYKGFLVVVIGRVKAMTGVLIVLHMGVKVRSMDRSRWGVCRDTKVRVNDIFVGGDMRVRW